MLRLCALILISTGLAAQTPAPGRVLAAHEPAPNLGQLKIRLIAYHDCTGGAGCYEKELDRQSDLAIAFLRRRATRIQPGEKLALVLDIDETSLSNWEEEKRDDFGYITRDWNAWVDRRKAPAIPGTLRLYNEARKLGVSVFFITGRGIAQTAATADSLRAAGYGDWAGLALRGPHPSSQTTADYKSGERRKIAAAGYKLVLNVGDQWSDLNGDPQAELSVKLPNPFYFIP